MDGCSAIIRKHTIRSAGRNRAVLNRSRQGAIIPGLDLSILPVDGSTDGIQQRRDSQSASRESRRRSSEAGTARPLGLAVSFCAQRIWFAFLGA